MRQKDNWLFFLSLQKMSVWSDNMPFNRFHLGLFMCMSPALKHAGGSMMLQYRQPRSGCH